MHYEKRLQLITEIGIIEERKNAIRKKRNIYQSFLQIANSNKEAIRTLKAIPKIHVSCYSALMSIIRNSVLARQRVWVVCLDILKSIQKRPRKIISWFLNPVNIQSITTYRRWIRNPMDLGTVRKKLKDQLYRNPLEFRDDMRLIWANCRTYNPIGDAVRLAGDLISEYFEDRWECSGIEEQLAKELAQIEFKPDLNALPDTLTRQIRHLERNIMITQARMKTKNMDPERWRDMTFEEKRNLSRALERLPHRELANVIEIVVQGLTVTQKTQAIATDSLELDIDALSRLTLWRLDGLVRKINI